MEVVCTFWFRVFDRRKCSKHFHKCSKHFCKCSKPSARAWFRVFDSRETYSRFSLKWPIILLHFVFLEAPNDHFAEQSFWWVGFSKKSTILVVARETFNFSGIIAYERDLAFYSTLTYCLRIGILHLQAMKWTVNATENTALCCICEFRTSRAMPAHIICEVLLYRSVFKLQPQTRCVAVTGNWIWAIQRA